MDEDTSRPPPVVTVLLLLDPRTINTTDQKATDCSHNKDGEETKSLKMGFLLLVEVGNSLMKNMKVVKSAESAEFVQNRKRDGLEYTGTVVWRANPLYVCTV